MLKPLHENVVLKIVEKERTTTAGLVLPGSTNAVENVGEVVALGDKVKESVGVSVGDRVVFKVAKSTGIGVNNEDYKIVEVDDILAVIE